MARTRPTSAAGALALGLALAFARAHAEAVEEEPVLDAASLAPAALLSGPGASVDPHVEIRGYMAHFTIDTSLGPLTADSVELLAERVAEVPAMEALDRVTRSQTFVDAAGDKVGNTASAIGRVVRHPIDTIAGIPAGVARYFSQKVDSYENRPQSLSDRAARKLGTDGNPYPSDDGPMTDARETLAKPHGSRRWYDRVAAEAEREVKRQLKYSEARREIAKRLGIDPYTSNPYVRERLDGLAWVGSSGAFATGKAIAAAIGPAGLGIDAVVGHATKLDEVVYKLPPDALKERNHARLQAHGRDELLMRQFLRRGAFSPTLQTAFVDALDALQPAGSVDDVLELGMTAGSELEARFLVDALDLLVADLRERAHGGRLRTSGAALVYEAPDGTLVVPLPVDWLSWTDAMRAFFDRPDLRATHKRVLIGGHATRASERALTERGYGLVIGAKRTTASPYGDAVEPAAP